MVQTVDALRDIGCSKATWFVDEYGYRLSEVHPQLIHLMAKHGEIAIHAHLNVPPTGTRSRILGSRETIERQIVSARDRLSRLCGDSHVTIQSIRSGAFLTNRTFFESVIGTGLKCDSSIEAFHSRHTMSWIQRFNRGILNPIGIKFNDIQIVKPGTQPFYLTEYCGGSSCLEFPVHVFTRLRRKGFTVKELVLDQIQAMQTISDEPVLTCCTHPFEFLEKHGGSAFYTEFVTAFKDMDRIRRISFKTLSEVYSERSRCDID